MSKSGTDQSDAFNIAVSPRPFESTVSTVLAGGRADCVGCGLNKF